MHTPPKAQSRARRTGQREPRLHGEFAKSALVEHSRPHVGHGWSGASPRPANARVNILAAQEAPARANSDLPAGRDLSLRRVQVRTSRASHSGVTAMELVLERLDLNQARDASRRSRRLPAPP